MSSNNFDVIRFNVSTSGNGYPRLALRSKQRANLMPLRKRVENWLAKVSRYAPYLVGTYQDNECKDIYYTSIVLRQKINGQLLNVPDTTICKLIHHLINVGCVLESDLTEKVYVPADKLPGTAHDIPEVVESESESESESEPNYSKLTVKQLKSLCRERGIKTTNLRKKAELSAALQYATL